MNIWAVLISQNERFWEISIFMNVLALTWYLIDILLMNSFETKVEELMVFKDNLLTQSQKELLPNSKLDTTKKATH